MAGVELRGVSKRFGDITVVHGIDLTILDGEFVVFVGPSGCGKSTLLRMICGLEPVSGGAVVIGGRPMRGVPPDKRGVAMVFQSYALYPHKTVGENMGFALLMQGMSRAERDRRVAEAAATLQLTPLLGRYPKELSGGQRQRVAIGRAIVRSPGVFLFDEPLSNLDAELRVQMRLELAKLHRSLGATMIFVTHDQTEAMTLADRIVVLRGGVVEQTGTPSEIYDAPANRFVAGFMGSPKMSFLVPERSTVEGDELRFDIPGTEGGPVRIRLAGAPLASLDGMVLGLRPEHFNTRRAAGPRVAAEIEFVERLGGESFLHAPSHPAGYLLMREAEDTRPVAGRRMVPVDWSQAHVFAADGRAVETRREA